MSHVIIKYIFRSALGLFFISITLITFLIPASAQEPENKQSTRSDPPYRMGEVLIQYDEASFSAQVNELEAKEVKVPGGLLDGIHAVVAPVSVANDFLRKSGIESPSVVNRITSLNTEVVNIGEGVDPLTVINKLKASPAEGILLFNQTLYTNLHKLSLPPLEQIREEMSRGTSKQYNSKMHGTLLTSTPLKPLLR